MERDKARSMSATSKDEDDTAKKSKSGIAKFLTRDLALKTRDKDKEKEKDRADAETRARSLTPYAPHSSYSHLLSFASGARLVPVSSRIDHSFSSTSVGGDATVGVTVSQSAGVAAQSSSTRTRCFCTADLHRLLSCPFLLVSCALTLVIYSGRRRAAQLRRAHRGALFAGLRCPSFHL